MREHHPLPPRLAHLAGANPAQLCEIATLRLEGVQALFAVLLRESRPDGARVSRHTLSAADGLLTEAGALYRRAFAEAFRDGRA